MNLVKCGKLGGKEVPSLEANKLKDNSATCSQCADKFNCRNAGQEIWDAMAAVNNSRVLSQQPFNLDNLR